jgi:hypothetical protein
LVNFSSFPVGRATLINDVTVAGCDTEICCHG